MANAQIKNDLERVQRSLESLVLTNMALRKMVEAARKAAAPAADREACSSSSPESSCKSSSGRRADGEWIDGGSKRSRAAPLDDEEDDAPMYRSRLVDADSFADDVPPTDTEIDEVLFRTANPVTDWHPDTGWSETPIPAGWRPPPEERDWDVDEDAMYLRDIATRLEALAADGDKADKAALLEQEEQLAYLLERMHVKATV